MAKRKKYPKLPNGYGSIKYLGSGRRNAYAVHPPTKEFELNGSPKTPPALCYVDSWTVGFAVLTAYRAGVYYPGFEKTLVNLESGKDSQLLQKILADYNMTKAADEKLEAPRKTFAEVYREFYSWKYEQNRSRTYSQASMRSTAAAFKNCAPLHDRIFADLRVLDLQDMIDSCPLKHSSKELILSLFHQMFSYAEIFEICEKDYSANVRINALEDDEHGVPFSDEELAALWKHCQDETVTMLLIMCYSGFRIRAYASLTVDLKNNYFQGGVKTAAGKDRIVPIHSRIRPLVADRMKKYGSLLPQSPNSFRKTMYPVLSSIGIEKHTPHDCRHTFSRLCEKYGVRENDRKRMLGHSFSGDITNSVYGHRELEDLRTELEKIR